jgi:hypothetical protein
VPYCAISVHDEWWTRISEASCITLRSFYLSCFTVAVDLELTWNCLLQHRGSLWSHPYDTHITHDSLSAMNSNLSTDPHTVANVIGKQRLCLVQHETSKLETWWSYRGLDATTVRIYRLLCCCQCWLSWES